jgi:hypothetical protein
MELKNAQRRCTEKSIEVSLIQCIEASKAQKEVRVSFPNPHSPIILNGLTGTGCGGPYK